MAWLADDAQEGRRAGTEAGLRAGQWIAAQLAEIGLAPAGEGGFTQTFEVPKPVAVGTSSAVAGHSNGPQDVIPMFCSSAGRAAGALEWRGYGIVNGEKQWNDFEARCDGKVVVIVRGTPPAPKAAGEAAQPAESAHGGNVQSGDGWGNSGSLFLKVMNAKRAGAVAVLVAPHPDQANEPLPRFDASRGAQAGIPALFISSALAEQLVPNYAAAIAALDGKSDPLRAQALDKEVLVVADVTRENGPATNVLARLVGQSSERCIVIGAHYDHLGWGGEGSLAPDQQGVVHNGADDNASGTAVVLEMARLLASGPKPACDVVFALWSGEELGLLGSDHWTKHPTVPLERVALNLNLDMVGRCASGKLSVLGAGSSAPLEAWLKELGPAAGLQLEISLSGQGVGGSDHQSFLKHKIPAVHVFTGVHADYHKPSDDTERFEAQGAAQIAGMCVELVRRAAQAPALAWIEPPAAVASPDRARGGGFRVWFGSVPEYSHKGPGILLGGTSAGSPAEKAGLMAGDILRQVGDVRIDSETDSMAEYMYALQTYKAGDVVLARFVRDGKELSTRVTLATREAQ
ncbi:MAG: M28 family peptidase [Planctomycetes bacterium]|nr:M28 family peptidase [Planctomycetota bacterium]